MKTGKIIISIPETGVPEFEFNGMINHRAMSNVAKRIKKEYMMYMRKVSKNSMADKQEQYRIAQAEEIAKRRREEEEAARFRALTDTTESIDPDVIPDETEEANITNESEGEKDDEGTDVGDAEGSGYSESLKELLGE
jgi:hypothetical protein